ncbi:MAG: type secretion system protein IcmB/DotO [Gammaproteobacteria bacterium]|nr:type secretion system protein IcmB/DotO [Gammaproteobacteria bacterium]
MSGKFEAIALHLLSELKTEVQHYCDLETIDSNALVGKDGSLASIVRFNGTKGVLGRDLFERMIVTLEQSLAVYFAAKGHQLQVLFRRDLDASTTLEANAEQQRLTADRLRLAVRDLVDEGCEKYSQYVYDEDCYLVFWSRPALLDRTEVRIARDEENQFRKAHQWPTMKDAQNLLRPIRFLFDRHQAFVSKICDDLSSTEFGCSIERLDVTDMLREVRRSIYPDYTGANWQPAIPGSPIPMRWKSTGDRADASELLYPSLSQQLMVATGEVGSRKSETLPDPTTVRLGSRVYAPLMFEIPPSEPQHFNALFNALNRAETREAGQVRALPYCVSFMLESDGMSVLRWKGLLANVLGITSETNRNINLAAKALGEQKRDGTCIAKLRIAATTWAGLGNEAQRELTLRKSKLWRILEGWGRGTVIERTGNPMKVLQSTALSLSWRHIGNPAPAPLGEALALMPFTRPASPFSTGSIIYRSLDGKILRYQRFSSEQTTWITLVAGKPGSGKSVLMNHNNVELCLMPGSTRLPYVCIIDIGISSSGFIDLIRDNLPADRQYLAFYKRLQNNESDAINPMDAPLGKREPLAKDRAFLVNFLATLATPPERRGKPYEGMSTFVGRIIDNAYRMKSDRYERAQPETYKPGHNPVVDEAVRRIGYSVRQATTYWELVDALFQAGLIYEAEVTQRYAVPILHDLVATAASKEIADEYGGTRCENGQPIHSAFILGLREAINDYPIFAGQTRFDIGSARVMALDLQDVALIGSDAAFKQTALMYMIARQSFLKKVAFSKEDLPFFDPLYRAYYEKLINDITEDIKVLMMDELHKTGGHPLLQLQLMTDGREARKWNLELVLGSQLMEDFGELTKIATTYFILDSGTEETRRWLRENVGLTPVEESALTNYVHGAGPHGCTFLARFVTKAATYSQLFTMTAGPMRLWALSTTAEDRKLRSLLYASLPGNEARARLARRFPGGSCKKLVERLKAEMFNTADFVDDDTSSSVIERIAQEIFEEAPVTAARAH